ncbi:MAG: hypothetical protein ABR595_01490 [Psychroflexus sp.]
MKTIDASTCAPQNLKGQPVETIDIELSQNSIERLSPKFVFKRNNQLSKLGFSNQDFLNLEENCATNIHLKSQKSLDEFVQNQSDCSILKGDLVIEGPTIKSLATLNFLSQIEGSLVLKNLKSVQNLKGLDSLQHIHQDLIISNTALQNLKGFEKITEIGGSLRIEANNKLIDFSEFSALESIGESLQISKNQSLASLQGLSEIVFSGNLENSVKVSKNTALESLSGFQIDPYQIKVLEITGNSELSVCNTWIWCDVLETIPQRRIADNAAGCQNEYEIERACEFCPKPSMPSLNSTEESDFILSWNSSSEPKEWQVALGQSNFNPEHSDTVLTTSRAYVKLKSKDMSSVDEIYIKSVCDSFSSSEWLGPYPLNLLNQHRSDLSSVEYYQFNF